MTKMPDLPKTSNILLIEDDLDRREDIVELLNKHNYQVTAVESKDDMSKRANLFWDLVIIDCTGPGDRGLRLIRRLIALQPNAQIIMMTESTDTDFKVSAYQSGIDMIIANPVNPVELLAVVYASLRRKHALDLKNTWVKLDPHAKVLTFRARKVRITANEALVLQTMVSSENNLTEFHQLKSALGFVDQANKNRLQVLISRLRKKIADEVNLYELIVAERGVGYKLIHPLMIV